MKKYLNIFLLFLVFHQFVFAQDRLVCVNPNFSKLEKWKKAIPILELSELSLISSVKNPLISDRGVKMFRDNHFTHFQNHLDDGLAISPLAVYYGLDLIGCHSQHNYFQKIVYGVQAQLIQSVIVTSIKHLTKRERPDFSNNFSFPSGHTAQAFMGATLVAQEYRNKSIWFPLGAYTIASTVGLMRILNNKHWTSDVLAGAAIGILSVDLSYEIKYKWKKRK